jgi:hypothetical protein
MNITNTCYGIGRGVVWTANVGTSLILKIAYEALSIGVGTAGWAVRNGPIYLGKCVSWVITDGIALTAKSLYQFLAAAVKCSAFVLKAFGYAVIAVLQTKVGLIGLGCALVAGAIFVAIRFPHVPVKAGLMIKHCTSALLHTVTICMIAAWHFKDAAIFMSTVSFSAYMLAINPVALSAVALGAGGRLLVHIALYYQNEEKEIFSGDRLLRYSANEKKLSKAFLLPQDPLPNSVGIDLNNNIHLLASNVLIFGAASYLAPLHSFGAGVVIGYEATSQMLALSKVVCKTLFIALARRG